MARQWFELDIHRGREENPAKDKQCVKGVGGEMEGLNLGVGTPHLGYKK